MAVGILVASLIACSGPEPGAAEPAQRAQTTKTARPTGCTSSGSKLISNGPRGKKVVALTFDDGPSGGTGKLLSILKANSVVATFFPQADKIEGRLAVVKRAVAAGHEFQNHSLTHADLGNGGQAATDEMRAANDAISAATGFTPCVFRPPFDSYGDDLIKRARALGMSTVKWDVSPADYEEPPAADIISRVLDGTKPGSIIVMHDGEAMGESTRPQTRKAVPTIIKKLKSRGYKFVTVTTLLGYPLTF
jgi:peptidoglycan/xylan/chitin deacetylase (PgdA/CDA1 family)